MDKSENERLSGNGDDNYRPAGPRRTVTDQDKTIAASQLRGLLGDDFGPGAPSAYNGRVQPPPEPGSANPNSQLGRITSARPASNPSNGVGGATSLDLSARDRRAADPTPPTRHNTGQALGHESCSPTGKASRAMLKGARGSDGSDVLSVASDPDANSPLENIPWFLDGHCIERKHCSVENEDGGMRLRTKLEIDDLILEGKIPVGSVKAFLKRKDRVLIKWNAGTDFSDEGEYWKKDLKMIHDPEKKTAWFRRNECDHVVSAMTVVYSVVLTALSFQTAFSNAIDVCLPLAGNSTVCTPLTEMGKDACLLEEIDSAEVPDSRTEKYSMEPETQSCKWVAADTSFFPFIPGVVCIGMCCGLIMIWILGIIADVRAGKEHKWGFAIFQLGHPTDPPPEKWLPTGHMGNPGPLNYAKDLLHFATDQEDGTSMIREMQEEADPAAYDGNYKPRA